MVALHQVQNQKDAAAACPKLVKQSCSSEFTFFFEEQKKALVFAGKDEDEEKRRNEEVQNKEREREEKGQERKVEGEKEREILTPAFVTLQQTAERGLKSGGRVKSHMVSILVQGLDGKHLSMMIEGSTRVSALCRDLSKMTGIPMDAFYLTRQTKALQSDEELWLEMDERVCMRGRLRGGMDGDWTCQHCGRQGCWVTKVRCYRCGKS